MKRLLSVFLIMIYALVYAQNTTYQYAENIKSLKKDQNGNVYLLGNQSVCKFEGQDFLESCLYTEEKINNALILSENEIFLAFENKLVNYKNNSLADEVLLDEVITALAFYNNHIVIGTLGAGIFSYSIESKKLKQVHSEGFINDILINEDNVYVIDDEGILWFDENFNLVESSNLSNGIPKQLLLFEANKFVILTQEGELVFFNSALEVDSTYKAESFKPDEIATHKGFLFAIESEKLKQWNGNDFNLLKTGNFEHLLKVKTSLLTSDKKTLTTHNILSRVYDIDKTFSIYADGDKFWLGREGKISLFHDGTIEQEIIFPQGYDKVYVSSLVVYDSKIYAGTMGKGILIFNSKTGAFLGTFQKSSSLSEKNVIQLHKQDDMLWIGYLNGLKAVDIESKDVVQDFTALLENNYLYRFYINSIDDFFLCTSDSGFLHVIGGEMKSYLDGNSVYSLTTTSNGMIFSAENNGIFRLNDSVSKLSDQYYFRSNSIYNVLQVNDNILFAHDFGVDLLNAETREIAYLTFENLNEANLNAHAIGRSKVLLGYEDGIIEFDIKLMEDAYPSELSLKDPLLFDQSIKTETHNFNYDENTWTFNYESTNFSASKEQYYKYRLLPLETEWVTTTQEKITYYNLPSGDYNFEISNGGHRNFEPIHTKDYQFSISKPFWQNPLFWMLIAFLLGIFIYGFIKYREQQIKEKEEFKTIQLEYEYQRLKDQINPHFLFNSFNSIIGIVEEEPKQAAKVLEKLSTLFRTILKYEKTEVVSLAEEIDLMKLYFEIHQLRFHDLIQLKLSPIPDAQDKFVIPFSLQLLVENAIKHNVINSKHKLQIEIFEEEDYIVVSNKINHKKKNPNSLGLGLNNLIKRSIMKLNKKPLITQQDGVYTIKIPYIYG